MGTNIFLFEIDDKTVLGFNTGLTERAFAQAKVSSLITETGHIVGPDGTTIPWKPEGVAERNKSMVIWGPEFSGVPLDIIIQNNADKNAALDALRYWLDASSVLAEQEIPPAPSPRNALIAKDGTVFFPPPGLVKRSLDAEGPDAVREASEKYIHPDMEGIQALEFSGAAMLYEVFSGEAPFPNPDIDSLRSDIREGVFIPPRLAAFGLDGGMAQLIRNGLKPEAARTSIDAYKTALGIPGSKKFKSFFKTLSEDEQKSLASEREQYSKRKQARVNTKRFIYRNTAIIAGIGIAVAVIGLVVWSIVNGRKDQPTTMGMTPRAVVEQYYASFETLDHGFMEAAVTNKAGKKDTDMVRNLFVITRVREAYEHTVSIMPAQTWLDGGSKETASLIFGVTELEVTGTGESGTEAHYEARYILWMPSNMADDYEPPKQQEEYQTAPAWVPPIHVRYTDTVTLVYEKDRWRISEIIRK